MLRTFVTATLTGVATLALVGAAAAQIVVPKEQEFYAVPLQKGAPVDLPGERMIPGAVEAARAIDVIVSPVIVAPSQSIGTGVGTTIAGLPPLFVIPGLEPAAAPAAAPAVKVRRHHRYARHGVRYRKVAKK